MSAVKNVSVVRIDLSEQAANQLSAILGYVDTTQFPELSDLSSDLDNAGYSGDGDVSFDEDSGMFQRN